MSVGCGVMNTIIACQVSERQRRSVSIAIHGFRIFSSLFFDSHILGSDASTGRNHCDKDNDVHAFVKKSERSKVETPKRIRIYRDTAN